MSASTPPVCTVLCALDFAPGSDRALVAAADLAERACAALHLVHVSPLFRARLATVPGGDAEGAFRARVEGFVNDALGAPDAFAVLAPELHRVTGTTPADGVLRTAVEVDADLVVVGTHGRTGLGHAILGSVATDIARRSPVAVLVVPERSDGSTPGPERPVVAAVDFSAHTAAVLSAADTLAVTYGAPLVLAHALDLPLDGELDLGGLFTPADLGAADGARATTVAHLGLGRLAESLASPVSRRVPRGLPETALVTLADGLDAGAVVVGTHGRTGADRLLHGSVAEWLARHAACPVCVLPGDPASPPDASAAVLAGSYR